jgi:oligopeptide/dipeptide ABC transporter ATP-binding protein
MHVCSRAACGPDENRQGQSARIANEQYVSGKNCRDGGIGSAVQHTAASLFRRADSAIPAPDPEALSVQALAPGDVSSPVNTPAGCRYHPRCLYAETICRQQEPPLTEIKSGHYAACHFPGIAAVERPGGDDGRQALPYVEALQNGALTQASRG